MLLRGGNHKVTSNIKKALNVITIQQANNSTTELKKPPSPMAIGNASILAPMEVPTISKIPPKIFVSIFCSHFRKKTVISLHNTKVINDLDFFSLFFLL